MAAEFVDYINKIFKLQQKEYFIIRDYEYRWKLFLRQEKLALTLIEKTETFLSFPREVTRSEINALVKDLQIHITISLRYVSKSGSNDLQIDRIVKEEKEDWDAAISKLETDTVEIRRNADFLLDGQVKHALILFLDDLDKEKDLAQKELKLNSYLERLLIELRSIIDEERSLLERELGLLQQCYSNIKKDESDEQRENLRSANSQLRDLLKLLRNILSKEHGKFINPYITLIDQKSIILKRLDRHKSLRCVSLDMIRSDLKELSPPQAERYLLFLEGKLNNLEQPAAKFYLRFKLYFLRKRDKKKYEKEDSLARTIEDMKQKLQYDPLMGIGNKDYFPNALAERIDYISKIGGIIALFYFDLDKFKEINDKYGHPAGDEVLKVVGKVARESISSGDIICRIGGEELAIILKVSSFNQAKEKTEYIRTKIESDCKTAILNNERPSSSIKALQKALSSEERTITMSGGLACLEISAKEIDQNDIDAIATKLIENADKKLYEAKQAGRNRVFSILIKN